MNPQKMATVYHFTVLFLTLPAIALAQEPPYDVVPPADPPYYRVRYEAQPQPGGLAFSVNYAIRVPKDVKRLRGVIVHQHGCGEGSCKSELTGAYDLHLESGLAGFIVERDGKFVASVPEKGSNPFARPVFQNLQYSDTPTQPLVPLRFTDITAKPGDKNTYRVMAVNTVGLKSKPSKG